MSFCDWDDDDWEDDTYGDYADQNIVRGWIDRIDDDGGEFSDGGGTNYDDGGTDASPTEPLTRSILPSLQHWSERKERTRWSEYYRGGDDYNHHGETEEEKQVRLLKEALADAKHNAQQVKCQSYFDAEHAMEALEKIYTLIAFMVAVASSAGGTVSDKISAVLAEKATFVELTGSEMAEIARSAINVATDEGVAKLLELLETAKEAVSAARYASGMNEGFYELVKAATDVETAMAHVANMKWMGSVSWEATCAAAKALRNIKMDVHGKVLKREPEFGCETFSTMVFRGFNLDPFELFCLVKEVLDEVIDRLPLKRLVEEKERWERIISEDPESKYNEFRKKLLEEATDRLEAGPTPIPAVFSEYEGEYHFCYSINPDGTRDDEEEFEGTLHSTPSPHHYILELRCFHRPFNGRWGDFHQIRAEFQNHPRVKALTFDKSSVKSAGEWKREEAAKKAAATATSAGAAQQTEEKKE